jgi:hypothetical protein
MVKKGSVATDRGHGYNRVNKRGKEKNPELDARRDEDARHVYAGNDSLYLSSNSAATSFVRK